MKLNNSIVFTLLMAISAIAGVAIAQDTSVKPKAEGSPVETHMARDCFANNEPIVETEPIREATEREQKFLDKILHVVMKYESQQAAFSDLDVDHNCKLDTAEVSHLLAKAKLKGIIRVIATSRMIDRYDLSQDGFIQWREFRHAIELALNERASEANPSTDEMTHTSFRRSNENFQDTTASAPNYEVQRNEGIIEETERKKETTEGKNEETERKKETTSNSNEVEVNGTTYSGSPQYYMVNIHFSASNFYLEELVKYDSTISHVASGLKQSTCCNANVSPSATMNPCLNIQEHRTWCQSQSPPQRARARLPFLRRSKPAR